MQKLSMLVMVVAALACGACNKTDGGGGSASAGAAPATLGSDDDYVKIGMDMSKDMITAFKADGSDCDKLADDLAKVMPLDKVAAAKAYETAHPEAKKKLMAASAAQMKEFETAAAPAMDACAKNQKLLELMAKLN